MDNILPAAEANSLARAACIELYDLETLLKLINDAIALRCKHGYVTYQVMEEYSSSIWSPKSRDIPAEAVNIVTSALTSAGYKVTLGWTSAILDGRKTTVNTIIIAWGDTK